MLGERVKRPTSYLHITTWTSSISILWTTTTHSLYKYSNEIFMVDYSPLFYTSSSTVSSLDWWLEEIFICCYKISFNWIISVSMCYGRNWISSGFIWDRTSLSLAWSQGNFHSQRYNFLMKSLSPCCMQSSCLHRRDDICSGPGKKESVIPAIGLVRVSSISKINRRSENERISHPRRTSRYRLRWVVTSETMFRRKIDISQKLFELYVITWREPTIHL